jgi:AraC family transcriptional regulator
MFTELEVWRPVGPGWRKLHGNFRQAGHSIEWHDFTTKNSLDWGKSFHPGSLEVCLNLSGQAHVKTSRDTLELGPMTAGFYAQSDPLLTALRKGGDRHQFITVEVSLPFLRRHVSAKEGGLHPRVTRFLSNEDTASAMVSKPIRLNHQQQQLIQGLQNPPVLQTAQRLWYHAKVLEVVAAFLYQSETGDELFCQRQHHLNQDRVQRVLGILKENLAEPPSLEELGRRVGCSHFYLSRVFTQQTGKTISVTLRDFRMERAAALLRGGKMNVTEVALEVGYSSLSHFSSAFREVIGCCPGLYPVNPAGKKL